MAARRKPLDFKGLKNSFQRDLNEDEKRLGGQPRYNSGNEQQSELLPSRPPPAAASPKAKPAPARKAAPTIPYKRPTPPLPPQRPPGPQPGEPPTIPGRQEPLVMPQYDPMGNPTGPMAPPAPGSSTQGWMAAGGPGIGQGPPLTGPGSDRMPPNAPPVMGQVPMGLGAADAAGGAIPLPGGAPLGNAPSFAAMAPPGPAGPGIGQGPPMTGPQSDRAPPPPGMLGGMGSLPQGQSAASQSWEALKRYLPPFGGI